MTPKEKIAKAIIGLQSERRPITILTEDERDTMVADLLTELTTIPRGERANKRGRKIRTTLRKLGFFISRQSS